MSDSVVDLQSTPNCTTKVTLWTGMRVVEMSFQMIQQITLSSEGLQTLATSPVRRIRPPLHQLVDLLTDFSVYIARKELG